MIRPLFASLALLLSACAGTPAPVAAPPAAPAEPDEVVGEFMKPESPTACGVGARDKDACMSEACNVLPVELTACKVDADCTTVSFATCECGTAAGPFAVVAKAAVEKAKADFGAQYSGECDCGCQNPTPVCVAGLCGLAPLAKQKAHE